MSNHNECIDEDQMTCSKQSMKNDMLYKSSCVEFNNDQRFEEIWKNNHLTKSIERIRHKDNAQIVHERHDQNNKWTEQIIDDTHHEISYQRWRKIFDESK
jgi:peptidyl-tRNA hydrolase